MKIIVLSIIFLLSIKYETWLPEVNGHNENDDINGYAGKKGKPMTDFYLLGHKKYRVHYLGDESDDWSETVRNGHPLGNGKKIDGIMIDDATYKVRLNGGKWQPYVDGYDIYDSNNGYAGV